MELSVFKVDQPVVARACMVQYVALILIILTFVIGAFANQKISTAGVMPKTADLSAFRITRPLKQEALRSVLDYNALFLPDNQEVDRDSAGALASLLKNHDIDAEIRLAGGADPALALWRGISLESYLLLEGVPGEAFKITITTDTEEVGVHQAVVHLYKSPPPAETRAFAPERINE